jgi:putative DNA primase/helicase
MHAAFELTAFYKPHGPLTKVISLTDTGELVSDGSACLMSRGTAARVQFASLTEFARHIAELDSSSAIALGRLRLDLPGSVEITTKAGLNGSSAAVARTQDFIGFAAAQPAVMLLDYDTKFTPLVMQQKIAAAGGFAVALYQVIPEFATAAAVYRNSTSAGISRTDTEAPIAGKDGVHLYILVQDGTDIERALKALQARCWLKGYGWLGISAAGSALTRSLVDVSVYSPERLVFEGRPILRPPLAQDQAGRRPLVREGTPLDTRAVIPDLDSSEQNQLNALLAAARREMRAELAAAKEGFIRRHAAALVERGVAEPHARRIATRFSEQMLLPDVELEFDDPDLAGTTVLDVIRDPERFIGETLSDPVEGPEYGRCKARIMQRGDGSLWIHSFAHGRTVYDLKYDDAHLRQALADVEAKHRPEAFAKLSQTAELTTVEAAQLRKDVAEACGVGLRAVDKLLRDASRAQHKAGREAADASAAANDILDPGAPLVSATQLVAYAFTREGCRTLQHQQGDFYRWDNTHYRPIRRDGIVTRIYRFLEPARRISKTGSVVPFDPDRKKVGDVTEALAAVCHLPSELTFPAWLNSAGQAVSAAEIMPCRNGLLHWPTQTLLAHTPQFFNLTALPYSYQPDAPQPVEWLRFLTTLWPADQESIDTLQEVFGLALTPNTAYQKLFLLLGPARSGKGTIARVLTALLGRDAVAGPTVASLGERFGLQGLIGKSLAIIADARVSGRADVQVLVERLLAITGEDLMSVPRKNTTDWVGKLLVRFIILTNELPRLADVSGAIASRFIILRLIESFYGREDLELEERLMAELPGILNWSLAGLGRLTQRGRFVQPSSSAELIDDLLVLASPIRAFIQDCCVTGVGTSVDCDMLFHAWRTWCNRSGRWHVGDIQLLGRNLRSVLPALAVVRPRDPTGNPRRRVYQGIGLCDDRA